MTVGVKRGAERPCHWCGRWAIVSARAAEGERDRWCVRFMRRPGGGGFYLCNTGDGRRGCAAAYLAEQRVARSGGP